MPVQLTMMMLVVDVSQAVKKMDRQPSLCSQLSMMQMRNSMASTSDTDDVLNQILRGGSAGSSIRKSHYRPRLLLTTSVFWQQTSLCEILSSNPNHLFILMKVCVSLKLLLSVEFQSDYSIIQFFCTDDMINDE